MSMSTLFIRRRLVAMDEDQFCVEYNRSTNDVCAVCGGIIERKNCLKMGQYKDEISEDRRWYHFTCFWTVEKYHILLQDEDPDSPTFEGHMNLKSTDKRKIASALKKLKNGKSNNDTPASVDIEEDKSETTASAADAEKKKSAAKDIITSTSSMAHSSCSSHGSVSGLPVTTARRRGKCAYLIDKDSRKYLQIEKNRRGVYIVLREYYWCEPMTMWLPTSSGEFLSVKEWDELGKGREVVDRAIIAEEKALDEPPKKKGKQLTGTDVFYCGDWDVVTLALSDSKAVCVRTLMEHDSRRVQVCFPYCYLTTDQAPRLVIPYDHVPISLTTDEWANMVQLREQVHEDLEDHFDIYCEEL